MGVHDSRDRGLGRFRGVIQVAQFNWPKVLGGVVVSAAGLAGWRRLPGWLRVGVLGALFWTPVSLVASWWVYDRSALRRWRFVADRLPRVPQTVLLVVAGFDEVSPALAEVFPDARIEAMDVVSDPEPSVRRARRLYPAHAPVVDPVTLGADQAYDLVLFAQSAHEIRDPRTRHAMLAAARRAVSADEADEADGADSADRARGREGPDGAVVVVEHVRDLANAVAFGPGFWHFQTAAAWRASFAAGGLRVRDHRTVTPLVHCWTLAPEGVIG